MFHQPLDEMVGEDRRGLHNVWVVELILILFSSIKYYILLPMLSFKSRTHFNTTCILAYIYWGLSTLSRRNEKPQLYFYGQAYHVTKRSFRKRSSTRRNLKTPVLRFSSHEKHFENGALRNRRWHDNHVLWGFGK